MKFSYYLREAVLLSYSELRSFEASKVGDSFIRKGARRYADRLLVDVENRSANSDFEQVLVIGDGKSDYYFFRQAEAYVRERKKKANVEGLFIRNSELLDFEGKSGHLNFFDSWWDLSSALEIKLSKRKNILVFVDIDRTLIFPRGEFDGPYSDFKFRALRRYSSQFATSGVAGEATANIRSIATWLEDVFSCYKNEGDVVCYSNYEVLALVSSLVLSGLIRREWLTRRGKHFMNAGKLLVKSRNLLALGSWPCRINGRREEGSEHWDAEKLHVALNTAILAVNERQPNVSPQFRKIEFEVMKECREQDAKSFLNAPLLDLLGQSENVATVVFSDRPASTVWDGEVFLLE